jgi:hypothetical protein
MKKLMVLMVMLFSMVMNVDARQARIRNLDYQGAEGTIMVLSDGFSIYNYEAVIGTQVKMCLNDVVEYEVSNGQLTYFRNLSWEARRPGSVRYTGYNRVDPYGDYGYGCGGYGYYGSGTGVSFSVGGRDARVSGHVDVGQVVGMVVNAVSANRQAKNSRTTYNQVERRQNTSTRSNVNSGKVSSIHVGSDGVRVVREYRVR